MLIIIYMAFLVAESTRSAMVDNAAWFIHSLRNFPLIKARSTRVSKGLSSKTAIIKKLHEHYKRLLSLQIYCECESRQGQCRI